MKSAYILVALIHAIAALSWAFAGDQAMTITFASLTLVWLALSEDQ